MNVKRNNIQFLLPDIGLSITEWEEAFTAQTEQLERFYYMKQHAKKP